MTKSNAFAGTGAFSKKVQEVQPEEEDVGGTFMVGAHFPKRIQWKFRDAVTGARTNVKGALAEALDDWLEKHGNDRLFGGSDVRG